MAMDRRVKLLLCSVVFVIGILYHGGIVTRKFPMERIDGAFAADSIIPQASSPKLVDIRSREPRHRHRYGTLLTTDELSSRESTGGLPTGVVQQVSEHHGEEPIGDVITVAVFTINPFWLFKAGFNQRTPVTYRCPNTSRAISLKSAYQNVTMTRGADVVIFARSIPLELWEQVLAEREPHQVWVYGSEEGAYKSPQVRDGDRPVGFGNFRFNMSFGYHSMSDVMAPYGEYVPFRDASGAETNSPTAFMFSELKRKTKLVAWVSSHCDMQQWDRLAFVQQLSEAIPIDTFGKCGDKKLPRNAAGVNKLKSYKFYLALENSCCREYITEKFWMSLTSYQAVPIVVGANREEYEKVAPPNSFIFAGDFESMGHLAEYLRKVGENDTLYRRFHEWRRIGEAKLYNVARVSAFSSRDSACPLLEYLEERAWKNSPLEMSFDPYGPDWLGSCKVCGEPKAWLEAFDLNSDAYNPTMRALSERPECNMRDRIDEHRRQIVEEYTNQVDRRNN